jgi:Ca2+-binding EF-hand superfamily protein
MSISEKSPQELDLIFQGQVRYIGAGDKRSCFLWFNLKGRNSKFMGGQMMKKVCGAMMMMFLVLALGLGGAMAQEKKPIATQTAFSKMDVNGDGVLTVAEFGAYWKGRFQDIDANKDGKLMAAEFEAATRQAFGAADTDKDNVLVAQEFVAYWCGPEAKADKKTKGKVKNNIDANQDGKVGKDECVVFWMARFNDMDANQDGKVTMDEFLTAMKKRFKEIDKNGDGFISVQEHDIYWSQKQAAKKTK